MDANDLKEVTEKNSLTYEHVVDTCSNSAKEGRGSCPFWGYFSTELITELAINGFRVSQAKGNFGEPIYLVAWV